MGLNIFLAGAAGTIGRALIPLLLDAGHAVTGTTRTAEGASKLRALGIEPVVTDVFNGEALEQATIRAAPAVVIHQLTDLSPGLDPAVQAEVLTRNARLRRAGTANLVLATRAAGAKRLIAQSIAWAYAPKDSPYYESDPLDATASGLRGISVSGGVIPLETAVLGQPDFEGIVLRYGELYGPGTWNAKPNGLSPVHVDAAAYAAFLAIDHGRPGAYNIAEPEGSVAIDKAIADLGWRPDFRLERRV
jgi:nucleoside-diphosphate-sugar epimerase